MRANAATWTSPLAFESDTAEANHLASQPSRSVQRTRGSCRLWSTLASQSAGSPHLQRTGPYALLRPATLYFVTDVRWPGVSGVGIALSVASPVR